MRRDKHGDPRKRPEGINMRPEKHETGKHETGKGNQDE